MSQQPSDLASPASHQKKKKKIFITIPKAFSIPPSIRIQKQEVGEIYKAAKHFFQSSNCDNKCKNNPFPSFLVSYVFTVICVYACHGAPVEVNG